LIGYLSDHWAAIAAGLALMVVAVVSRRLFSKGPEPKQFGDRVR
jgi:hypothetical protein